VPATENSPAAPEHTIVKTLQTMSPENKAHYESEKEAIHLILTGIEDEKYLTFNACKIAQEIWEAIERFMTIVKQQHKLDEVSYHKLFDILKQYQKEVNEPHAERIARNANPLALVATAQSNQDPYYQTPKSHKPYAPTSKASILNRSHALTRNKGKEIAKPITPPFDSVSKEDSYPEQAQRDKDMQKNLALIAKYFKKIYKPTNNNLRTSSNSRNKNVDTIPRENVGSPVVQQTKIQCFNSKEFDTDDEIDKQELEANYSFMAKIQEVVSPESNSNAEPLEQDDSDVTPDLPDMCEHDIQTYQNIKDERVALANLIANVKLDVDENKKIQNQLKKVNTSLAHELKQCKSILAETSKTLQESNSVRDSCLVALQTKQTEFEKYKACNDHTIDYDKLERKLNKTLGLLAQKTLT
nr:hypothetical protein [Tanacetum cinerariifolium]